MGRLQPTRRQGVPVLVLRNLRSKLSGSASGEASSRPEALRRRTLATNARVLLGASLVGSLFAIAGLFYGMLLPFVLAVIGMTVGTLSTALCNRGQFERAAAAQVYGMFAAGVVLALADPAIADFGLATALLAPVHASLLTRSPVKKRSWAVMVTVVLFATLGAAGVLHWPEPYREAYALVGAAVFALWAVIVGYSANRLNSAFEVYEKAQINAYKHLIEHVQDAVMRFSAEGRMVFTSRSAERLFGCRRYELTGGGLIERVHVLDRPAYLTALADANRGTSRTVEVRMRRDDPDASVPGFIWIEVAFSPVEDAEGPRSRSEVVALLRDVTRRKDVEREMERARREAEQASEAKSRFLATIGHELRTPLNAIVGFSEMMTNGIGGELPPTHREYASLIRQSGIHLIDVVKMLLDMGRIEAGRFDLQTEPFQPEQLVEPCFQMVDGLARARSITLRADVAKSLPPLVADERACRQILINLLSNAIKFSRDGAIVDLAIRRQGGFLRLSVADRGIGMSADAAGRIGEPFFQGEDGLSRQFEGTGLGLSIVKGLVELHEGQLHVQTAPGQGTTMTVLLPLNGPATKLAETARVTPLRPEAAAMPQWPEEKRKAQ